MKFQTLKILLLAGSWLAAASKQDWPQDPRQAGLQQKEAVEPQLTWRFPEPPVHQRNFPPEFSVRRPAPPPSVEVECGEGAVRVEVHRDLLGVGQPALPSDLWLGDCPPSEVDGLRFVFQYPLHSCGSQLRMTEDVFLYRFLLSYSPSALGTSPIVRTAELSVTLECHYPRHGVVSSAHVRPTWTPLVEAQASEEGLLFSLKLMTDDWQFERPTAQYFLGDLLNLQASVSQLHHPPLRLLVDSCVATLTSNPDTVPRYSFLDNYGCLMDGFLTASSSHILPRLHNDRLHIQLEAFRFQQEPSGVMYITCSLRATTLDTPVSATSKACSFSDGWMESSGAHSSCSCCETLCGSGGPPAQPSGRRDLEKVLGPISVKQRPPQVKQRPLK